MYIHTENSLLCVIYQLSIQKLVLYLNIHTIIKYYVLPDVEDNELEFLKQS